MEKPGRKMSSRRTTAHSSRMDRREKRVQWQEQFMMKPSLVADEMFPEGAGPYMDLEEAGGSSGLLMDLAANEKSVHADFFNDFEDLFDDEDLQ